MYDIGLYWTVYKLFHDPPGTPEGLKCVGCKVAGGGASLAMTAICMDQMRRSYKKNAFKTMGFGFASFGLLAAASVFFRVAHEHDKYNKDLIKRNAELIKARRKEGQSSSSVIQSSQ